MKISKFISKFLFYQDSDDAYNFDLYDAPQATISENEKTFYETTKKTISHSLLENLNYLKTKYNLLINSDIKLREFKIWANNKSYNAFIF